MISVRPTARSPIWGLKILSSMNESSSWTKSSTLHKSLPKTWTLISKKMLRRKRIRYVKSCPISYNNYRNSAEEKELALWFSFVILSHTEIMNCKIWICFYKFLSIYYENSGSPNTEQVLCSYGKWMSGLKIIYAILDQISSNFLKMVLLGIRNLNGIWIPDHWTIGQTLN